MAAPAVYAAINAVSAELAQGGVAKTHTNTVDDYKYRSIDDVLERLAPLLARHRLCILPRVLEREAIERRDEMDRSLFHVSLRVAFSLTSVKDGSTQVIESYGEALDPSDKATAKAMSAAYKSAMVQTFCIRCGGAEEPDKSSYKAGSRTHISEPVQGWAQWALDIEDIVGVCTSQEAVSVVQDRNRTLLNGLCREQPAIYRALGEAFTRRLGEIRNEDLNSSGRSSNAKTKARSVVAAQETEDA